MQVRVQVVVPVMSATSSKLMAPLPLFGSIGKRLFVLATSDYPPFVPLKLPDHVKPIPRSLKVLSIGLYLASNAAGTIFPHTKATVEGGRRQMPKSRKKRKTRKRVLALPDLEQAKSAVLNTLTSKSGQRTTITRSRNSWNGTVRSRDSRSTEL